MLDCVRICDTKVLGQKDNIVHIESDDKVNVSLTVVEQESATDKNCVRNCYSKVLGQNDVSSEDSHTGWFNLVNCQHSDEDGAIYIVKAKDKVHYEGDTCEFKIYSECAQGTCSCTHRINDAKTQLKPCRIVCEAFLRGDTDPDWEYVVYGAVFGFNVIDPDCDLSYFCANYSSSAGKEGRDIMSQKLRAEIAKGAVSVVDSPPKCVHAIGLIPKNSSITV